MRQDAKGATNAPSIPRLQTFFDVYIWIHIHVHVHKTCHNTCKKPWKSVCSFTEGS